MKKIIFALYVLCFTHVLSAQTAKKAPPQYKPWDAPPTEMRPVKQVEKTFPFNIPLKDTAGTVFNSGDLLKTEGKPLVLMFWLTTCGPCRQELDAYKANFDAWKKETDFRLIAISTDFPQNAENFVKRVKVGEWQFEAYHDYLREFGSVMPGELNGLPQVFILDKQGNISYHHRRFMPGDEVELFAKIKEASNSK